MVGSVNSVATGNVYLNASDNTDIVLTETTRNVKDTQAYQALVKLVGDGYKGADETKEDKAAVRKEAQQLLSQLYSGIGSSDTSTGNVVTVSMPKASSLLTLLIAMIESENESSVAGYKMSGDLGVISQDFTNAAADELRQQGVMALSSGITSGLTQAAGASVAIGYGVSGAKNSVRQSNVMKSHVEGESYVAKMNLKADAAKYGGKAGDANTYGQAANTLGRAASEGEQGSFGMATKNSEAEQTTLQASSKMMDQTMEMSKETAQKAAQVMSSLLSLMADVRHSSADLVSTVSSNLKA
ncbi:hypothetical protein FDX19_03390 [Citrobacter sp. wls619]|uniref:hypothetical protein n=1 Tax=Citrobacter sp. wls619 TaxID=2576432 RepID=UPI0010C94F29|nr:hypothetical protein [Citrobacter sp. wls619]TKV12619.1 hypothetical protein FDX19_03390 [Citrobacter sp. wls619]